MTENEALSTLNSLDQEIGALLAQRQAARQIAEVIAVFQVARKGLDSLRKDEAAVKESILDLERRYEAENVRLRREQHQEQNEIAERTAQMRRDMDEVRIEHDRVVADFDRDKTEADATLVELRAQIKEKSDEFDKVQAAFDRFKQRHGLTGD